MKALEFLKYKKIYLELLKRNKMLSHDGMDELETIDKAIKELEALQEENEHLKRMVEAFKKDNI